MATVNRLEYPIFRAFDSSNNPLVYGKLYTYDAGTNNPKVAYEDQDGVAEHTNPITLDGSGQKRIYLRGAYKLTLKDANDVPLWTEDNVLGIGANNYSFASIGDYGNDLQTMVTALAGSSATVLVDSVIQVTASVSVPSTIQLQVGLGGRIDPDAGIVVTLGAAPIAGDYQIFGGDGQIVLPACTVSGKWWGAAGDYVQATGVGTDDTVALNAALSAMVDGSRFILPFGAYRVTESLQLTGVDFFRLEFVGSVCPDGSFWDTANPTGVLEISNCTNGEVVPNFEQTVQARWGTGNTVLITQSEDVKVLGGRINTAGFANPNGGKAGVKIGDDSRRVTVSGTYIRHNFGVFVGGGIFHTTWTGCFDILIENIVAVGNNIAGREEGGGVSIDSPDSKSQRIIVRGCHVSDYGNGTGTSLAYAVSNADYVTICDNTADDARELIHVEDGAAHVEIYNNKGTNVHTAGINVLVGQFASNPIPQDVYAHHNEVSGDLSTAGFQALAVSPDTIPGIRFVDNVVNRTGAGTGSVAAVNLTRCEYSEASRNVDYGAWDRGLLAVATGDGQLVALDNQHFGTYVTQVERLNQSGTLCHVRTGIVTGIGDIPVLSLAEENTLVLGTPFVSDTTANHTGGGTYETLKQFTMPPGLLKKGRAVRLTWRGKVFGAAANNNQVRIQLDDGSVVANMYEAPATTVAADNSFYFHATLVYKDSTDYPRLTLEGYWNGALVVNSLIEGSTLDEDAAIDINFQATTTLANGVLLYTTIAEVTNG